VGEVIAPKQPFGDFRLAGKDRYKVLILPFGAYHDPYGVSIQKLEILVEIKACEEFYRRPMADIPRIEF
jgi:hypothetical protein